MRKKPPEKTHPTASKMTEKHRPKYVEDMGTLVVTGHPVELVIYKQRFQIRPFKEGQEAYVTYLVRQFYLHSVRLQYDYAE